MNHARALSIVAGLSTLLSFASLLEGCNGSSIGFQGGVIPEKFNGILQAAAISPQSFQLSWDAYTGANKYKIYVSDKNEAIFEPGFTSLIFQPVPSDPNRTYQYSVTAIDPNTNQEMGDRTRYTTIQLLPHFNFRGTGSVVASGKTSIRVNWEGKALVTYRIYVAERQPTGAVNYNNFVSSNINVVGASTVNVNGLQEGKEYCAIVVAAYADQTNDGPEGTMFTSEVSATLSSPAWMVGPSGTFGDSKIGSSQKCARTQSDFSIANMRVYAPKATLSGKPTFYVDVPGDTTEDSAGTVETAVYQVSSTGLATFIGKRNGTGKITATAPIAAGRYKYFAILTDLVGAARAQDRKEIIVGTAGTTPADEAARQWVYIRSFGSDENPSSPNGYYPAKQQAGYGSQKSGSSVAMGDFNCDGKADLAFGVPNASIMAADSRPAKAGKVIVYYDVSSGSPASPPRSQIITFDITQFAGDPGRDLRLGTKLHVGNFNRDNQITNQHGSIAGGQTANFRCDDLAIGSGYGPMFVLYGKRDISGPNGGLNYTNPTSYTVNPSTACDPSTNVCEASLFVAGGYTTVVGRAITSGDFNGDSYSDLVATTGVYQNPTSTALTARGTLVFRGSEFGLIPPTSYTDGTENVNFPSGPYPSFPYLPINPLGFAPNPTPAPGWSSANLGVSVAPLYNSYYDIKPTDFTKGTKRVRDILLIGSDAGNGRVFACRPETDFTGFPTVNFNSDPNTGLYWNCTRYINPPVKTTGTGSTTYNGGFGVAMTAIKNPLRYQPNQFTQTGCEAGAPNCDDTTMKMGYPGAVAIGSTLQASVFVYYIPFNPGAFASRDAMGNGRNILVEKMFQQIRSNGASDVSAACSYYAVASTSLCVEANNPCKLGAGGTEYCDVQRLTHPTSGSGGFGTILATLVGNNVADVVQPKDSIIAVAAPDKNLTVSGGISYIAVGSVQLYMQNSNFASNPIVVLNSATPRQADGSCPTDQICRYADGFSNTLTNSIDYDGTLSDNINFGEGGIASGSLESDAGGSGYNNNNDIVVGAPGHIARVNSTNGLVPVYDNGAALVFFSHGGTYRPYRIATGGPAASPWHLIERSFSQESDIKFHLATAVGDLNVDGTDDVAVRINSGSRNRIRVFYGRSDKIGFFTAQNTYQDIDVQGDYSAGLRVVPLGRITNGQFPAFLIGGKNASYIYFSGINGLIQGAASAFGLGGTPRKLYAPVTSYTDAAFGDEIYYLDFGDRNYPNNEVLGSIDSTLNSQKSFAHGDYNGDGFEDVAITMDVGSVADTTKSLGCPSNYCFGGTGTSWRVMVFYGGSDNGFQKQPNSAGGYPLTDWNIADYSVDNGSLFSPTGPCTAAGTNCKIQMLYEGSGASQVTSYGGTITSVPLGTCLVGGNNVPVSGLVVKGTAAGANGARLYVYKPKCLETQGNLSGLTSFTNDNKLVIPASSQSSSTMGFAMAPVKNLLSSSFSGTVGHLMVVDQGGMKIYTYPIFPIDAALKNFGVVSDTANGGRTIDYTGSNMLSGMSGSGAGFGDGIADIGDINGDGFGDVAIGISKLTRKEVSSQILSQGGILVLFGGKDGLQAHAAGGFTTEIEPIRDAFCYTKPGLTQIESVCNPTLVFLPQSTNSIRNGAYERAYLGVHSKLNFGAQNENLGSFLIGTPGRDSLETLSSERILNGGAFYVLP